MIYGKDTKAEAFDLMLELFQYDLDITPRQAVLLMFDEMVEAKIELEVRKRLDERV